MVSAPAASAWPGNWLEMHILLSGGGVWTQQAEMAPHKGKEKKEEQVISLGPQVAEGENVFGACHIFASFLQ